MAIDFKEFKKVKLDTFNGSVIDPSKRDDYCLNETNPIIDDKLWGVREDSGKYRVSQMWLGGKKYGEVNPKEEHKLPYYYPEDNTKNQFKFTPDFLMKEGIYVVDNQPDFDKVAGKKLVTPDILNEWQQYSDRAFMPEYGNGYSETLGQHIGKVKPDTERGYDLGIGYGHWTSDADLNIYNQVNSFDYNGYINPRKTTKFNCMTVVGTDKGGTTGDWAGYALIDDSNAHPRRIECSDGNTYYRNTLYDLSYNDRLSETVNGVTRNDLWCAWVNEDSGKGFAYIIYGAQVSGSGEFSDGFIDEFPQGDVKIYKANKIKTHDDRVTLDSDVNYLTTHVDGVYDSYGYVVTLNILTQNSTGINLLNSDLNLNKEIPMAGNSIMYFDADGNITTKENGEAFYDDYNYIDHSFGTVIVFTNVIPCGSDIIRNDIDLHLNTGRTIDSKDDIIAKSNTQYYVPNSDYQCYLVYPYGLRRFVTYDPTNGLVGYLLETGDDWYRCYGTDKLYGEDLVKFDVNALIVDDSGNEKTPSLDANKNNRYSFIRSNISFYNGVLTLQFSDVTGQTGTVLTDKSYLDTENLDTNFPLNGSKLVIDFNNGTVDLTPYNGHNGYDDVLNTKFSKKVNISTRINDISTLPYAIHTYDIKDKDGNIVPTEINVFDSFKGEVKFMYMAQSMAHLLYRCNWLSFEDRLILDVDRNEVHQYNPIENCYEKVVDKLPVDYFTGSHISYNDITEKLWYSNGTEITQIGTNCGCGEGNGEGGVAQTMVFITHEELRNLRDTNQLIPGVQYRIIDYITTTTQQNTKSVNHQFDIITFADDESTLNENVRFDVCYDSPNTYIDDYQRYSVGDVLDVYFNESYNNYYCWKNSGKGEYDYIYTQTLIPQNSYDILVPFIDGNAVQLTVDNVTLVTFESNKISFTEFNTPNNYWINCNLESWEGKYCIDNDTARFAWADETNGKGVIYWLKDEYNNECPYDFKNIQFKRYGIEAVYKNNVKIDDGTINSINDSLCYLDTSICYSIKDNTTNIETYRLEIKTKDNVSIFYYTFSWVYDNIVYDASVNQKILKNVNNDNRGVMNNIIQAYNIENIQYVLNNNVFVTYGENYDSYFNGIFNNILNKDCCNNTFGGNSCNNILEYGCYNNIFGNEFCDNKVGSLSRFNVFGYNCKRNTINHESYQNVFGINCYSNILGDTCFNNIFGDSFTNNILGDDCSYNTFETNCHSNHFGNECEENESQNSCENNRLGDKCSYNIFGVGCTYNTLDDDCCNNHFSVGCYYNIFAYSCYHNVFGEECGENTFGSNSIDNEFGNYCVGNKFGNYCNSNTFGVECCYNTFGNNCGSGDVVENGGIVSKNGNIFGNNCYNNTFGNEFTENYLGDYFFDNTFGNSCWNNEFYNTDNLYNGLNTFGDECWYNVFDGGTYNNTIKNSFRYNTIGSHFYQNNFENWCEYNYFGSSYQNNKMGNDFKNNKFLSDTRYCTFGNNCQGNDLPIQYLEKLIYHNGVSYTKFLNISTGSSNKLINIEVLSGVNGDEYNYFYIDTEHGGEFDNGILIQLEANYIQTCGYQTGGTYVVKNLLDDVIYITYNTLKDYKSNGYLIPGVTYRITDYQCTINSKINNIESRSNGGSFDILVVADDNDKLNENVRFIHHEGDTYFSGCKLESWEGKYCLDNDTTRFAWADPTTNGKGVIYWLKDEWGNECGYDFKNIQFKRTVNSVDSWYYTFNGDYYNNNKIQSIIENSGKRLLNRIVFNAPVIKNNIIGQGCYNLYISDDTSIENVSVYCGINRTKQLTIESPILKDNYLPKVVGFNSMGDLKVFNPLDMLIMSINTGGSVPAKVIEEKSELDKNSIPMVVS